MEFVELVNPKAAEYFKNAILIPSYLDTDGKHIESAAYDKNSNIIESSKGHPDFNTGTYLDTVSFKQKSLKFIEGKSLFLGKLTNNYSQFFFDALSRVKSMMRIRTYDKIVFALDETMPLIEQDKMFDPIKIFLEAFYINSDKLILLDKPMKFNSLRIPELEVSEHNLPDDLSMERVVNRMTSYGHKNFPDLKSNWNSKIYVTSRHNPNTQGKCKNEEVIENYFMEEGYSILDPFTTPFVEQLAIYDNTKKLIAIENEIIYNHIYCRKDCELVILSKGNTSSIEDKLLALNYHEETNLKYILFENIKQYPDGSFEFDLEDIKQGINSDLKKVIIQPMLNQEGLHNNKIIAHLDSQQEPDYVFCQIGNSKAISHSSGTSFVISPLLKISSNQIGTKTEVNFYQKHTAEFFEVDSSSVFANQKIDLAVIDGPKKPKKLLRDFLDLEAHSNQTGKILVPHILSNKNHQQDKVETLWKMVVMLQKFRKDLSFTFLNSNPSGLLIISNLDPSFKQKNKGTYNKLLNNVNKISDEHYDEYLGSIKISDGKDYISKNEN